MRSKAHFKSHPLHPMLIVFPTAFLIGSFLFDGLSIMLNKPFMLLTGQYLQTAGIIAGLVAAVPGFIDYQYTVPPNSSAKQRATKHALINVGMLIVFTGALIYRQSENASSYILLVMEVIGVTLLSIAGWMGGTMVHRNQIGVDVRYANAGKWNELYVDDEQSKVEVATIDELQLNQMKLVHVKQKRIVVARTEEGYVAFDDFCTHKGGSLAGGSMMCGTVQCPWHGSQFDVETGEVKAGPAKKNIKTYTIKYESDKVFLVLSLS
jgi:nitrite reductase/ring-hydroxylating ferredoxin subunit/uncharacterized membrane protein